MNRNVATVLVDALFLLVLFLVVLPHELEKTQKEDGALSSALIIEVFWQDGVDTDVDLWLRSPDGTVVGYPMRNQPALDLLRDDRGLIYDDTRLNYEVLIGRNLADGEYVANLHLYSDREGIAPLPVQVKALLDDKDDVRQTIFVKTATLYRVGQEITVARWSVRGGKLVRGSVHETFAQVRPFGGK